MTMSKFTVFVHFVIDIMFYELHACINVYIMICLPLFILEFDGITYRLKHKLKK